jgi:anti-sigma factor RsiW
MLLNTPFHLNKSAGAGHVTEQLAAYLDYELPEAQREAVRAHLRGCPQCENDLATLRAAKQVLRDAPQLTPPRSFKLNVDQVAALGERGAPARPLARRQTPLLALSLRFGSVAAAVLLVLLLTADLLTTGADNLAFRATGAPQLAAPGPRGVAVAAATSTPAALQFAAPEATPAAAIAKAPVASAGTAMPAPPAQTAAPAAAAAPAVLNNQDALPPATTAAASGGAADAGSGADQSVLAPPDTAPAVGGNAADSARIFGAEAAPAPAPRTGLQFLPWEIALGLLALAAGVAGFAGRGR